MGRRDRRVIQLDINVFSPSDNNRCVSNLHLAVPLNGGQLETCRGPSVVHDALVVECRPYMAVIYASRSTDHQQDRPPADPSVASRTRNGNPPPIHPATLTRPWETVPVEVPAGRSSAGQRYQPVGMASGTAINRLPVELAATRPLALPADNRSNEDDQVGICCAVRQGHSGPAGRQFDREGV